jgi:hypothetical protein
MLVLAKADKLSEATCAVLGFVSLGKALEKRSLRGVKNPDLDVFQPLERKIDPMTM